MLNSEDILESEDFGKFDAFVPAQPKYSRLLMQPHVRWELTTLESALAELKKCEIRLSLAINWIITFHGKVPDSLKAELKAAEAEQNADVNTSNYTHKSVLTLTNRQDSNGSMQDFGNIDESSHDDPDFEFPASPPAFQTEEFESHPASPPNWSPSKDPSQVHELASGWLKVVDIRTITAPLDMDTVEVKVEDTHFERCAHCAATFVSQAQLSVHALIHARLRLNRMEIGKEQLVARKKETTPIPDSVIESPRRTVRSSTRSATANAKSQSRPFPHISPSESESESEPESESESESENAPKRRVISAGRHPPPRPCEFCGKCFTAKNKLDLHISTVHPNETVKCKLCDKSFPSEDKLKQHMGWTHPDPNEARTCEVCGKVFKTKGALDGHRRQTHPDPKLAVTCDECDVVCKNQTKLRVHKMFCHGEKTFLCQTCGTKVVTQALLNWHMRTIHATVRAYKCTHCPQDFKTAKSFNLHISRHLGKVEQKCPHCGIVNSNMANHILIVHRGRKFKCAQCPLMFSIRAFAKNHYVLRHPEVAMPADSEFEVVYTGSVGNSAEPSATPHQDEPAEPGPAKKVKGTPVAANKIKSRATRTLKSSLRSKVDASLSCPTCPDAAFFNRYDYEVHMQRHEKRHDYKLKHRLAVKRLHEPKPVDDLDTQHVDTNEAQAVNAEVEAGQIQDRAHTEDFNAAGPVGERVPNIIAPLCPTNEFQEVIEDIPSFPSYTDL